MILYAKGRQFLKWVLILAVLAGAVTPARAETDLTLTTRFIQGSFDILLPDGWVAALTADGRVMEAQSPERHKLSINARVHNADEVAQARKFHLGKLRDSDLLNVDLVGAHRLLDGRLKITVVRPRFTEESGRSEEHTSELQSLMRISYAVFCLIKKKTTNKQKLQDTNPNLYSS